MTAFRKKAVLIGAGVVALLLCALEVVTYALWAEPAMPVAGIRHLRDYDHIADSRVGWQFAYVTEATWRALSASQGEALVTELRRLVPTVYRSFGEVPEEAKVTKPLPEETREKLRQYLDRSDASEWELESTKRAVKTGRGLVALKDGFEIKWLRTGGGFLWMRCRAGWYVSGTGAEQIEAVFVWLLGRWVPIRTVWSEMA